MKATQQKHVDFQAKKDAYWTKKLMGDVNNSSKLWKSMSKLLGRDKDSSGQQQSALTADLFAKFFAEKVKVVRASTEGIPPPTSSITASTAFTGFQECSALEVRRVIMTSPTKSCALDPIPTFLLKELVDTLLPFLTLMINASLREGHLPGSQKHAIVSPLLKKSSLDATDMKNYRPVSNLTFTSKTVERIVAEQMTQYLNASGLMPRFQSAYRRCHSTETALLRVLSDIYAAADKQCLSLLGLLDLSAAFDCVDHAILINRLQKVFGINDTALKWITSFLSDRSQQISYSGRLSATVSLLFGVPQGSILGPLFYNNNNNTRFKRTLSHSQSEESQVRKVMCYRRKARLYSSVCSLSCSRTDSFGFV